MLIMKGTCRKARPSNAWQMASIGTIAQLHMLKVTPVCGVTQSSARKLTKNGHSSIMATVLPEKKTKTLCFSAHSGSLLRQLPRATHCCQNMCEHCNIANASNSAFVPEAHNIFAKFAPVLKLLWCDVLPDRQMQRGWLQILPKCQNVHTLHKHYVTATVVIIIIIKTLSSSWARYVQATVTRANSACCMARNFGGMEVCEEAAHMVVAHGCHMLLML